MVDESERLYYEAVHSLETEKVVNGLTSHARLFYFLAKSISIPKLTIVI
jgi:hypothetical protein